MKTIYLSGPIVNCTDEQCFGWRRRLQEQGRDIFTFLDPTRRDSRKLDFNRVEDVNLIVEGDREDIRQADGVIANMWKPSIGTAMGIMYAWTQNRPIVVIDPAPSSHTLRYYADVLVNREDEAIPAMAKLLALPADLIVIEADGSAGILDPQQLLFEIRRACLERGLDAVCLPKRIQLDVRATVESRTPREQLDEAIEAELARHGAARSRRAHHAERGIDCGVPRPVPVSSRGHRTLTGHRVDTLDQLPASLKHVFETLSRCVYITGVKFLDMRHMDASPKRVIVRLHNPEAPRIAYIDGWLTVPGERVRQNFRLSVTPGKARETVTWARSTLRPMAVL